MFIAPTDVVRLDKRKPENAHEDKCYTHVDTWTSFEPNVQISEQCEDAARKTETTRSIAGDNQLAYPNVDALGCSSRGRDASLGRER
jgi:hypothetical protein